MIFKYGTIFMHRAGWAFLSKCISEYYGVLFSFIPLCFLICEYFPRLLLVYDGFNVRVDYNHVMV